MLIGEMNGLIFVVSFIHDSSRYDVQILFRPLWKDIEKVKKLKPGALRTWIWN